MSKAKKCSCKWKKPLILLLVLAVLAFIGWLVYYFFYAPDPDELDGSLFARDKAAKPETAPEEPADETGANAGDAEAET